MVVAVAEACALLRRGVTRAPLAHAVTIAASALVVALLLHTSADPDLWGHLAFGRQTLADGLGRTDVFSYTAPGAPVLNHEWLADVVTYSIFHAVGPVGIVLLRLTLLGTMLALIAHAVRRAGGQAPAIALVGALVVVGGFPWFVTARPQLWTFAFLAAWLVAIVHADDGDVRPLLATPLMTVVWVNVHGGIVAGLALLVCWAAARLGQAVLAAAGVRLPALLARGTPTPRTAAVIVGVLALHVPAALVNHFGVALWRFFAETLSVRRAEIGEWQPLSPTNVGDLLGVAGLLAIGALVVRSRRARDPVHLALALLLAYAATGARRHLALAVIAAAIFGASHAADALAQVPEAEPEPADDRRGRALPATALAVAGVLVAVGLPRAGCVVVEPGTVPRAAVGYLRAAQVQGRLAVLFDWGSYAIWHLSPRLRVSIDGRREAVYTPARLDENATFLYGRPGWRAPLDRDGVDLALVSPRFAVHARLAAEPDWRVAYADDTATLFVRRGSAVDAQLARTSPPVPTSPSLCLSSGG